MSALFLQILLVIVPVFALLLIPALFPGNPPGARRLAWVLPAAALPGLAASLFVPLETAAVLPWVLLEGHLVLDPPGRLFLLFISLLWLFAGAYAAGYLQNDERRRLFGVFFLMAMSGNFGVLLARDIPLFYLSFALMSFSSYLLVIHGRTPEAMRAGRVYIWMVVLGELCIFAGLLLAADAGQTLIISEAAAAVADSPRRNLIMVLLIAGFGIKAGLVPLHLWLPLAHPVAPTPASAVLSGAMIKTGLFGLIRFLPLGETALVGWGEALMAAGAAGAFYGVVVGAVQDDPKTVLAYSSVSQMGFCILGLGIGLGAPEAWPAVLAGVSLYALHHGLAKGALFLGVGVAPAAGRSGRGVFVSAGLLLPALAMAGAPFTSGALAKISLKPHLDISPGLWPQWGALLLSLAAVGTTILMGRYLFLLYRKGEGGHLPTPSMLLAWGALVAASIFVPWFAAATAENIEKALAPGQFSGALWPVALGAFLVWVGWWRALSAPRSEGWLRIPPGDLVVLVEKGLKGVKGLVGVRPGMSGLSPGKRRPSSRRGAGARLEAVERGLAGSMVAGAFFLVLILLQFVFAAFF